MKTDEITKLLLEKSDSANADFQYRLAPTLNREQFLGVRVPELRRIEKQLRGTPSAAEFLKTLPHKYYDQNLLHSIFISNIKDYNTALSEVNTFLPYVDNWAACDTLKPAVFKKAGSALLPEIEKWIASPHTYTCRFGIDMLMTFFLDGNYKPELLEIPSRVVSSEYYVNMMIAWFYATALAKHWDDAVLYLEKGKLGKWVHNKTIQKAVESYRITSEQKQYLKALKKEN